MKISHSSLVSIGECMVEMAPTSDGTYSMGFAGDTFNTIWYARKLLGPDWRTSYVTAVGTDAVSDRMVAFMDGAGVDTGFIERLEGKSAGLYMIQLQDGERSFSYWRETAAARELAHDRDRLDKAMANAGIIYFSGITIAVMQPAHRAQFYAALAAARAAGSIIAFDPNLRPRLWPDTETMCTEIMRAAAQADIALPSFDDERDEFGDADLAATVARYRAVGVKLVVVKNGDGDMLVDDEGSTSTHSAQADVDVVDSTAAGDSFNAGFLTTYANGASIGEAVQIGAKLAAKVIGNRGGLVDVD